MTAVATRLTLADARRSPCLTCSTTPCCTHLPVHTFRMTTLMDLDEARYLLNFDGIELGLSSSGEWSVYYGRPCRFLDTAAGLCTIHATERQPQICRTYNPYTCWYKRAFGGESDEFVWVDREALDRIGEQVAFDEHRTIVEVPSWEDLLASAAPPPVASAAAVSRAVPLTLGPTRLRSDAPAEPQPHSYDDLRHPCDDCGAYCCTRLVFPKPRPATNVELDFWRLCLGFPGVEVGIGGDAWSLIVETTCRHLDAGGRCSVYGSPERPLRCSYYDEWKCAYKPRFGGGDTGFLRMGLDEFDAFLADLTFDAAGRVL
ncbi:hypothetical protein Cch01nite_37400 [Cellulomonas chitinilytica]|uniref:YkgJ family cysteine cluster protein n=1 Tax=Cellulomonas chitinilytica TaxID=398759 RepID=A0A919U369_9CELL|nr:YkgJ family cysteine cluster protein [Cellulomonas chitinilytica]GIG23016.1 hypothetical protein Cch01nite_37400 [Cellulomonas chitinilytica]